MNRVRHGVALVQEGSLYVLLFFLPFSKAAVEIAFGGLFLSWLVARLDPKTRRETIWLKPTTRPILFAGLGFLAACALSVAVSTDVGLSIKGLVRKWLEYLLFVVIVADVAGRKGVVQRSLMVIAISALLVVIEGVTQERYGRGFFRNYRLDFFNRMTGPYENPIDLATYLMVVIPLLMIYALFHQGASRWRVWGLVCVLILCLARTSSIGAWLGLGIGLVVMSWWRTAIRRYALTMLVVTPAIAGVFFLLAGRLPHVFSISDIGKQDRWAMWQAALGMIRDRPVLGHGVNTFMANYMHYWVGGERTPRYAHNCYLQMAAETGVVGLAAFLWLLWAIGSTLVARIRQGHSDEHLILVGLAAGLLAFLVQAGVDTNFYSLRQAALFWTLAGLALGLSERLASKAAPS